MLKTNNSNSRTFPFPSHFYLVILNKISSLFLLFIHIVAEGFQSLNQHVYYHGLIPNKIHGVKQNTVMVLI